MHSSKGSSTKVDGPFNGPSVIIGLEESRPYQRFADGQQEIFTSIVGMNPYL